MGHIYFSLENKRESTEMKRQAQPILMGAASHARVSSGQVMTRQDSSVRQRPGDWPPYLTRFAQARLVMLSGDFDFWRAIPLPADL